MITVWFDGKCGMCSREIAYYRRIAPEGRFFWLDVATTPAPLEDYGISQADALLRLHAVDAAGRVHVGVAAFRVIWAELRWWNVLAVITGLPGVRQVAERAYEVFARRRFARLEHCQLAQGREAALPRAVT